MRRRAVRVALVALVALVAVGAGKWWGGRQAPRTRAVVLAAGQTFPSTLVLEAGRPYRLTWTALDREHRVSIPALRLEVVARPGEVAETSVRPTQPGTYTSATGDAGPLTVSVVPAGQGDLAPGGVAQVALLATRQGFLPQRLEVPQGAVLELGATSLVGPLTWMLVGAEVKLPLKPGELSTLRLALTSPGTYTFGCADCELARSQGQLVVQRLTPGAGGPGVPVGRPAPDFDLEALAGGRLRLSDLRGRVVVVNFWATWCGPCRAEMPVLEQYHRQQGQNLTVVGVNMGEEREKVAAYVRSLGLTFPIGLDPRQEVGLRYGVVAIPSTFVVDAQGVVRAKHLGPLSSEALDEMIRRARR